VIGTSSRSGALQRARLYVVCDARGGGSALERFLDAILEARAGIVQLRDKQAEAGDLLKWAETFRRCADRHDALFIVNDRPDVAVAAGADGVHLGQNDLPARTARALVGEDILIGLSTHDAAQFDAAPPEADYLCVGPVHATPTKPGRPAIGLDAVRHAAATPEARPWFAIGGIDAATIEDVAAAGATRVVVVRAVTEAEDPGAAAATLLRSLPSG